jgi:hypothetical protein
VRDYNAPSTVWWQLNAIDDRGNPVDEQLANGVHILANNDGLTGHLNWRTSGTNASSWNNQQNLTYAWDKNENLKDRIDVNQSSLTEHFEYDADPSGGLPIQPADSNSGGAIRSVTAKFDLSLGIAHTSLAFSFGIEFGAAYSNRDGFGWVGNFGHEYGALAEKGVHAGASIGGQITLYDKPASTIRNSGTCRAHW